MTVAVIAHRKKTLGGGLPELRTVLAEHGIEDPLWFELKRAKEMPKAVRKAIDAGAEQLFLWGGDGTIRFALDAAHGEPVDCCILPAGTGNLLATNLGIPIDLRKAVEVGLHGDRRKLDLGVVNDERFAIMAGAGFDAVMMRGAEEGGLKDRIGKLAYFWSGAKAVSIAARKVRIEVDGAPWFSGRASCILLGSMGSLGGALTAFPDAQPDDGLLEVGVVSAQGAKQWVRVLTRMATAHPERSPFVHLTRARTVDIRSEVPIAYELDGSTRRPTKRLKVSIEPGAIRVCVPRADPS